MSVVLTGPRRGTMEQILPNVDDLTIQKLRIAIMKNDHVVHVECDHQRSRFVITHDLNTLKGNAFSAAAAELDKEISTIFQAARDARLIVFSG